MQNSHWIAKVPDSSQFSVIAGDQRGKRFTGSNAPAYPAVRCGASVQPESGVVLTCPGRHRTDGIGVFMGESDRAFAIPTANRSTSITIVLHASRPREFEGRGSSPADLRCDHEAATEEAQKCQTAAVKVSNSSRSGTNGRATP